jgi:ribosome maturation factor RimP
LGLDRPLIKSEDFKRRLGELINLVLLPGSYPSEVVEGKLILADDDGVTLLNHDQKQFFSYDDIKRGKIIY